jgi:hypothetical protein
LVPEYVCQRESIEHAASRQCQRIMGGGIDEAIGRLVVDSVSPMALEVALNVQQELRSRLEEANGLRHKQVERAQYEADLARRRYMKVDPDNRLVADTLEADWNQKLRRLAEAQETYERGCQSDRAILTETQRQEILSLAVNFPRLWNDPRTPQRERKRMIRLLIEDVTLIRNGHITAHVYFKGGATHTLTLPLPLSARDLWTTPPKLVEEIDRLLDSHTCGEIAAILNERGIRSPRESHFHTALVWRIQGEQGLKSRYDRLREKGLKTLQETAEELGVITQTVVKWRTCGLLKGYPCNDKNGYLYESIPEDAPARVRAKNITENRWLPPLPSKPLNEVQYEA